MPLVFDRFIRYEELVSTLDALVTERPRLVAVEEYGRSYEGRPLLLVTITDSATGAHETKPAHWVDANIHAVELTGGASALHLIHHLVTADERGDAAAIEALRTRTFYVVPRVNPDGVEAALADSPTLRRSSMRPWPYRDRHQWPGLAQQDVDGDGRVLSMRIADPDGAWTEHPDDPRVMTPVPIDGIVAPGTQRYRVLTEGLVLDYDGFTIPRPSAPEALDLNRNFPAGWGTTVRGSGDHPLSEPEIDALVRAIVARPNICGYNAYHTDGGVLLRPSSTVSDDKLPPVDLWVYKELGRRGTALTGYEVHSTFEDFTWDKGDTMSGAADDWTYEHLGVYSWTTEYWDVIHAATGVRAGTDIWFTGPTPEEEVAVAAWSDRFGEFYVPWRPFDHPQLGPVEIGGADWLHLYTNPPQAMLVDEIKPHAEFAVTQALAAPELAVRRAVAVPVGSNTFRIDVGIANIGWLPTNVTARAIQHQIVLPITVELDLPVGAEIVGGSNRRKLDQLAGRSSFRLDGGSRRHGTPDRQSESWLVRIDDPTTITVIARHQRAGTATRQVVVCDADSDGE